MDFLCFQLGNLEIIIIKEEIGRMTYKLAKITQFSLEQVLKFAALHYYPHQILLKHLNIKPEIYVETFQPVIKASYSSGFSFAAHYDTELASIILSMPYLTYKQVFSPLPFNSVEFEISPIMNLLSQVQSKYKPVNVQKTIKHFMGCTDQKFKGSRFLQKLIIQVQKQGFRQGYSQYLADCTTKVSQKILQKLHYQQKHRILYNKFIHEGKTPFVNLIDSDCVVVMSKIIQNDSYNL